MPLLPLPHEYPFNPQLRDEELSTESQESNWFSAPSALRIYGEKLELIIFNSILVGIIDYSGVSGNSPNGIGTRRWIETAL